MTRGPTAAKTAGTAAHSFRIKRIYEPAEKNDGFRVLVDRLWPRGIAKAKARIDLWLKDIAPSDELRHRVHADPTQWKTFVSDYGHELKQAPARAAIATLQEHIRREPVTLLYAARDEVHNNAVALKHWLDKMK
jgi:uncharacterized protein YeaO (DUF488 family)